MFLIERLGILERLAVCITLAPNWVQGVGIKNETLLGPGVERRGIERHWSDKHQSLVQFTLDLNLRPIHRDL